MEGVRVASLDPLVPPHTPAEALTQAELIAAVVWLASGYQQAVDLADALFRTPPATIQEHITAAEAIATGRAELTAVRVRVATLLDQSAHLRDTPDRRHLKAASNY
jgi:hypothetical protein